MSEKVTKIIFGMVVASFVFQFGCTTKPILKPAIPNTKSSHHLGIRVGMLPPIDNRPAFERKGVRAPFTTFFASSGAFYTRTLGGQSRSDGDLRMEKRSDFGDVNIPNVLGSYVLDATRQSRAFDQVIPLQSSRFSYGDLPRISERSGLDYLMTVEIRHFYALNYGEKVRSFSQSTTNHGSYQTVRTTSYASDSSSPTFDVTVLRFKLWNIRNGVATPLWQKSIRASLVKRSEPSKVSGSSSLTQVLRGYQGSLQALTQALFRAGQR